VDGRRAGAVILRTCLILVVLAMCAACISSPGSNAQLTQSPSSRASVVEKIVALGESAETTAGNTVTVHSFLSSIGRAPGANMVYVAADVQACAGPKAPRRTGVNRQLFAVETPDSTGWPSRDPVKEPALKATYIKPKECVRGWVTFSIPENVKAQYVVLLSVLSNTVVKWKLP
jgi:hypothetical protein